MVTSTTLDTPENWGAASREYAEFSPRMMGAFAGDVADRLEVDDSTNVLEVAAGTGAFTQTIAQRAGSVLATDFAPKMIEVLRERMQAAGVANVAYQVMDGQALELEDASFDRSVCCFGLMLFPDRVKGFSELRRVTRPGGRVVVTGWAGLDQFEAFALLAHSVAEAFPDMPRPPSPPIRTDSRRR